MIVVGLTGGIGSGKSTVARLFCRQGAELIDADAIAHKVIRRGTAAYEKIVSLFGEHILGSDREIDRKRLGKIVFDDPTLRKKLDQIVHPVVYQAGRQRLEEIKKKNPRAVVIFDVPLLLESGGRKEVDKVIVVWVSTELQMQRLMERDGITPETAKKRIDAQMALDEKLRHADFTIDGSLSLEEVEKQVVKAYRALTQLEAERRIS